MMNREMLQKLRKQIVLNSLYLHDYYNNMGISKEDCYNFFEGYIDYISEIMEEEQGTVSDNEYFDNLIKYDTIDNLESWYYCFDTDPLPIIIELEEVA